MQLPQSQVGQGSGKELSGEFHGGMDWPKANMYFKTMKDHFNCL